MAIIVASWNIEKNGQSSTDIKQGKVSDFLARCCSYGITVIFLCEVHSSRIADYTSYCASVYGGQYNIDSLPGGHSNAYVVLTKKDAGVEGIYQDKLKGLNRGAIMVHFKSHFFLCLAHFKSGQSGLTKDQLQTGSSFLESSFPGSWAITGDMNWDYANRGALTLPGNCHAATCWADRTQVKGGLLDWCLVGGAYKVTPVDVNGLFPAETNDMTGPDHRPVIFSIEPA